MSTAADSFPVEVVTPAGGVVLSREAGHVRLPGLMGSFGVLAGHADMVAALGTGLATVEEKGGAIVRLALSGGYAQVTAGRLLVLAESAELPERVDAARAEAARDRARARMTQEDADMERAQASLARAMNRLELLGRR